ncbi:MAG: bifunctional tetrahydrofolate synthase/dihydrofolate synthase [Xanthomonadales bacterium]|nr:bifunctional tetrahydrofolate synthase/dihydrofolate synthase [Xanthomonadales bacterium]ODU93009.1 MAG: bifunctional folylpolyglutamate synthase/dihydrofolate synthase [Rhodanobacter sp. SCN 66-43]OJY83823.1 MAG: bifunctional folylpolyglutamate synthase/dihydrofolate synthase [Xanthomonadales bacterium 66-474]
MRTLAEWLDYQQQIHTRGIDMGLDRVRAVWQRMGAPRPAPVVITVGGTNGKGSTIAFLEAMLRAGGMRVGTYTSPHILRYNERVRVDGVEADDMTLVAAFERIEAVRGLDSGQPVTLTYFEFGTLAALDVFARAGLEVALLEVGLGGRLDAVNIVDADCAVVVTVDLDHMEYLGPDRESIGREKAGIFRAGKPAIVGETDPPQSLLEHAQAIGAQVEVLGRDFGWEPQLDALRWWHRDPDQSRYVAREEEFGNQVLLTGELALEGAFQYHNAATAVAALHALGERVRWDVRALQKPHSITAAMPLLPGRLQHLASSPDLVVDVGHNPQAARELARWLDRHPVAGGTYAVFGALADKDIEAVVAALGERIQRWYLAGLADESPRGEAVARLAARVRAVLRDATLRECPDIPAALAAARAEASADDRIIAFGSFHVVGPVLREVARL